MTAALIVVLAATAACLPAVRLLPRTAPPDAATADEQPLNEGDRTPWRENGQAAGHPRRHYAANLAEGNLPVLRRITPIVSVPVLISSPAGVTLAASACAASIDPTPGRCRMAVVAVAPSDPPAGRWS